MSKVKYLLTIIAVMVLGNGAISRTMRAQTVALMQTRGQTQSVMQSDLQAGTLVAAAHVNYTSVSGIVVDSLGKPVSDATIEISNGAPFSTTYARTMSNGVFTADSLVAGQPYVMTVIRLGYREVVTGPFVVSNGSRAQFHVVMQRRVVTTVAAL